MTVMFTREKIYQLILMMNTIHAHMEFNTNYIVSCLHKSIILYDKWLGFTWLICYQFWILRSWCICTDEKKHCVLYLIIIIKSEVWSICHCLGLGHEIMVCTVCFFIFLWGCICIYSICTNCRNTHVLKTLKTWPDLLQCKAMSWFFYMRYFQKVIITMQQTSPWAKVPDYQKWSTLIWKLWKAKAHFEELMT